MKTLYSNYAVALLIIAVPVNGIPFCDTNCNCESGGGLYTCYYKSYIPYYPNETTDIYLLNSRFPKIEKGAFHNLNQVRLILVRGDNLTTIKTGAFKDLPALVTINLQSNEINTIQQGSFEDLPVLDQLYMDGNQIVTLQPGTFKNLPALTELTFEGNAITPMPTEALRDVPSVTRLRLGGNNITEIKTDEFKDLPALSELDLGGSKLIEIPTVAFKDLPALSELSLRYCQLTFIRKDAFKYNINLKILDLIGNQFAFVSKDSFTHNIYLDSLHLDLFCDCNVPFWSWLKSKSFTSERVSCLDRNGVELSSLEASDFDNCTNNACNHTNYCSNGGSCSQNSIGELSCSCVGNWSGASCTDLSHLCAESIDKFNTTWIRTAESTLATVACTGEYMGNASRYCSSAGKWEEPNYSNCINTLIQHLKEKTAKLSGDSEYNIVTIILKDLENITRDNNELRSGDLLTSSSILTDIAQYGTYHSEKLLVEQLEIFGSLCDNLLDEENHQTWKDLIDEESGGVTSLVKAVTEFNDAFNDVIDENFSLVVVRENVVMDIGKASSDEITVPDRTKTSESWISESATEIKLNLDKNTCSGLTGYSSTFYRNISNLFPDYLVLNGKIKSFNGSYDVNSIIADFTIHGSYCLDYILTMKFDHLLVNYSKPFCGHWNFSASITSNGAWSSFGSQVVEAADSYTICEYNHTTNFAILMSPGRTPLSHHFPLSLISAIGCGVSILFLVITIITHIVLWRYVRNDRTKTLMNLCVALIMSYVIFLAGITQTENKVVCSAIAIALHYMFLTDFALMLAEGIHIVRMVVIIFPTRSIVNKLIPACWIVPAGIVGICASVTNFEGYGNQKFCWLTLESNLIWAFIGPALLVILINFIIVIITVYKMMNTRGLSAKSLKMKSKVGLKSICVMVPLFGVTWVVGAFSVIDDLVVFQYLFAIFNSLQGLYICLMHCFLNDQVRQGYGQYKKRRKANRMDATPSSEGTKYDIPKTAHQRKYQYSEEMKEKI